MDNLENTILEKHFRLTSEGAWLDETKQVWINEGFRLDNSQPIKAYLFSPKLKDEVVENIVRLIESDKNNVKLSSAAQKIGELIIPYVVFETLQEPEIITVPPLPPKQPEKPETNGKKLPIWLIVIIVIFVLILLCILATAIGVPIIRQLIQTPTP